MRNVYQDVCIAANPSVFGRMFHVMDQEYDSQSEVIAQLQFANRNWFLFLISFDVFRSVAREMGILFLLTQHSKYSTNMADTNIQPVAVLLAHICHLYPQRVCGPQTLDCAAATAIIGGGP